jgi:hypothetical protein
MHRIRLLDKTHYNVHAALEYAVPDAKRGFWTGRFPIEGRVGAFMCDSCGRLVLYGIPYHEAEEPAE